MTPEPHRGEGKWDQFLKMHIQTLWACDFFCANVWTLKGLRQYWMVLFIHLGSRSIFVTPSSEHPDHDWMSQQADRFIEQVEKDATPATHLIHDRDSKFEGNFGSKIRGKGIKVIRLPQRSPDMNAFAERAIRSVKHECLNHFVILRDKHLNYLIQEYVDYYNNERPHSSREFLPPCRDGPAPPLNSETDGILCDERLGGLFKHYYREVV